MDFAIFGWVLALGSFWENLGGEILGNVGWEYRI
jgi:hypothetical protein